MKRIKLTIEIWPECGLFVGRCRETGVASCGSTVSETIRMTADAIAVHLESVARLRAQLGETT